MELLRISNGMFGMLKRNSAETEIELTKRISFYGQKMCQLWIVMDIKWYTPYQGCRIFATSHEEMNFFPCPISLRFWRRSRPVRDSHAPERTEWGKCLGKLRLTLFWYHDQGPFLRTSETSLNIANPKINANNKDLKIELQYIFFGKTGSRFPQFPPNV